MQLEVLFQRNSSLIRSAGVTNEKGKQQIVWTKMALLHLLFVA